MRSYQVFAALSPERASQMLGAVAKQVPAIFAQALGATSAALKARPVYLRRQPFEKQAEAVRRALARVALNDVAEELLAVYFLECRKELVVEWLDLVGIEHEEGTLKSDEVPAPPVDALGRAAEKFRAADGDPDRELLLHAFAAQSAVDWPDLDALLRTP